MEEVKSKGKLKGFTTAIISAAEKRAEAVRTGSDEREQAAIEDYRARAKTEGERRTASALADARAKEEKRVMTETLAARRSLLKQREDCAAEVIEGVRARLAAYPESPEYGPALDGLLRAGLAAVPEAKSARVLLRRDDISHTGHLKAAAGGVELSFAEGFINLGGLIIEFPEQCRRADLTFDSALEELAAHFTEMTGFGTEGADGQ